MGSFDFEFSTVGVGAVAVGVCVIYAIIEAVRRSAVVELLTHCSAFGVGE